MEWTREKPTKPGHYWLRAGKSDPYMVEVFTSLASDGGSQLYVDDSPIAEFFDTVEWAGPLEPPP